MKIRHFILILALLGASCSAKNERSDLVITSVIPPTATATGTGATATVTCAFNTATPEFTPSLPFNPAENAGFVAGVVSNNLINNSTLSSLRLDTNTFQPEQAVITYQYIGAGGATPPGQPIVSPTGGVAVPSGSTGTVGFNIFNGLDTTALPAGAFVRTIFHLEGKLLDGQYVHTSEREYLFQVCRVAGCGTAGPWAAVGAGGVRVSCL